MKTFELWLDESGNFTDEHSNYPSSFVGGVLLESGIISTEECRKVMGTDRYHATEEDSSTFGDTALKKLRLIMHRGAKLVVFENRDKLEIVDGDTTYLNVFAEGIIQLLQSLIAEYGQIKLVIVVAVRKAMDRSDYEYRHIIDPREYELKLQEKIILGLARKSLTSINKGNFITSFSSARTDHRLMIADCICHSWYARNRKFSFEQRQELESYFEKGYYFSIFENGEELKIKKLLSDGYIGDAIFELFSMEEADKLIGKYTDMVLSRLSYLSHYSVDCQLRNVIDKLKNLLYIDNSYDYILNTLSKIHKILIPKMKSSGIETSTFFMDISLLILTVTTHQGNIRLAEQHIVECDALVLKMVNRWESLDYYFVYKIRKFQHDLNCYNLKECIRGMDELEKTIDDILPLCTIAEGIGDICSDIKSSNRGKTLGNRLQARFHTIRYDKNELALARKDSEAAMKEFEDSDDLSLQYQYRCRLEYEAGNYNESLVWLYKSVNFDKNCSSFNDLLNSIKKKPRHFAGFTVMHYTSIMAELITKDANVANEMFKAWTDTFMDEFLKEIDSNDHPFEIINWKLAKFHRSNGSLRASDKYFWRAVGKAGNNPNNITLKAIELGIRIDMLGIMLSLNKDNESDIKKRIKECCKTYDEFINLGISNSMKDIFSAWSPTIDKLRVSRNSVTADNLIRLSKDIIY